MSTIGRYFLIAEIINGMSFSDSMFKAGVFCVAYVALVMF